MSSINKFTGGWVGGWVVGSFKNTANSAQALLKLGLWAELGKKAHGTPKGPPFRGGQVDNSFPFYPNLI